MNILISSVGRRNYIVDYFKSALHGKSSVIVTNSIKDAAGMYVGDKAYVSPPILSPDYIPFLLDVCKKENIKAILPLFDLDVSAISFHKDEFLKENIFPIVADYNVIKACFDKLDYPGLLHKAGIKTPKTYLDTEAAVEMLDSGKLEFPLVLKPRWGTGSISTIIVKEKDQLIYEFNRLAKGLLDSFLENPVPEGNKNQMIIQQFIKGDEFGMDVINDLNGNYVTTFVKKKLGMRSGETDGAITIKNEKYEMIGEKIGNLLKHIAILDVDFIVSETAEVYIIDMNPRFGGGYPFTHAAGVNLPAAIISWLMGESATDNYLKMADKILSVKGIALFTK